MASNFQLIGLPIKEFSPLFALSEDELLKKGARRILVDSSPGYPCRVSLTDAKVGEHIIGIEFLHHDVASPYRGSGPIFVRENAKEAQVAVNEIPEMLSSRLLSVRAYDKEAMMVTAEVLEGSKLEGYIREVFEEDNVAYLHLHNARPGCYNCSVTRA